MPTLKVRARNICNWPSDFHLQGLEKRIVEPDEETKAWKAAGFLTIDLKDASEEAWFEVINIRAESIPPGEELEQSVEVDYDVRPLVWGVPQEAMRKRFLLLELTWGEHNLLKEPGAV